MRRATIGIAAAAAIGTISIALAQQAPSGIITKIDRLSGTITLQQAQTGTVGATEGGATEQLKVQNGAMLDSVHAGDRVTYSVSENAGVKTITKIEKR